MISDKEGNPQSIAYRSVEQIEKMTGVHMRPGKCDTVLTLLDYCTLQTKNNQRITRVS